MIADYVAAVLLDLASVLALMGIWLIAYRAYRIDRYRQNLFNLRDQLFDYALAGNISFEHPAYRLLRVTINGHIRFAHRLSFAASLFFAWRTRHVRAEVKAVDFEARFAEARQGLPEPVATYFTNAVTQMHLAVAEQVVLTSPTAYLLVAPAVCVLLIMFARRYVRMSLLYPLRDRAAVMPIVRGLDDTALVMGRLQTA